MSKSAVLVRSSFTIIVIWAYLVFGNGIAATFFGGPPTNAQLGIVAVAIFLVAYIAGSLVIRGIHAEGKGDEA